MAKGPTPVHLAADAYEQAHGSITHANADAVAQAICGVAGVSYQWARRQAHAIARYGGGAASFGQLPASENEYWRHTGNFR